MEMFLNRFDMTSWHQVVAPDTRDLVYTGTTGPYSEVSPCKTDSTSSGSTISTSRLATLQDDAVIHLGLHNIYQYLPPAVTKEQFAYTLPNLDLFKQRVNHDCDV